MSEPGFSRKVERGQCHPRDWDTGLKEGWDWKRLTLLPRDGEGEEGDEGHHSQQGEEATDKDEKLEPLQPSAPVVLQVHDVCDEGPERQHTWGDTQTILNT